MTIHLDTLDFAETMSLTGIEALRAGGLRGLMPSLWATFCFASHA